MGILGDIIGQSTIKISNKRVFKKTKQKKSTEGQVIALEMPEQLGL